MLEKTVIVFETKSGSKYHVFQVEHKGRVYLLWKRETGVTRLQDKHGIFLEFLGPVKIGKPVKFSYTGPNGGKYITNTTPLVRINPQ